MEESRLEIASGSYLSEWEDRLYRGWENIPYEDDELAITNLDTRVEKSYRRYVMKKFPEILSLKISLKTSSHRSRIGIKSIEFESGSAMTQFLLENG